MLGQEGPFGYIGMGGMFTVLKVREQLTSYDDPGWYRHDPKDVASPASEAELARDGIVVPTKSDSGPAEYSCRHHPAVRSKTPGRCPDCGMTLTK
jgi:hypothetical protein